MNSFKLTDISVVWIAESLLIYYNKTVIARLEHDDIAQIRWIWVDPEFRRKGIAKVMINEVERKTGLIARPMPPVNECAKGLFQ